MKAKKNKYTEKPILPTGLTVREDRVKRFDLYLQTLQGWDKANMELKLLRWHEKLNAQCPGSFSRDSVKELMVAVIEAGATCSLC